MPEKKSGTGSFTNLPPLYEHLRDNQPVQCPTGMCLNLNRHEEEQLRPLLDQLEQMEGLKILVCPGSNWPNKQLSCHTLQTFLQEFSNACKTHFLLVWGSESEKKLVEELFSHFPDCSQVVDRLSLPVLQNLMGHVDLVLSMDSLPLHLAGTTKTPTYSFFGPSLAEKFQPMGDQHHAVQGSCPYGQTFEKRCRVLRTCQTGACMKQMDGSKLFDDFRSKLSISK
jgi:heptosyltransferase-1